MLVLRNANNFDMLQYFSWVNDGLVRQNSILIKPVDWAEHQEWFKNKLNDKNCFLYLAENKQSKVGQVRFDCDKSEAELTYSISFNFRGQGLGEAMLKKAIEKFRQDYPSIKVITAQTRATNTASNKILQALDFIKQDITEAIISYKLI